MDLLLLLCWTGEVGLMGKLSHLWILLTSAVRSGSMHTGGAIRWGKCSVLRTKNSYFTQAYVIRISPDFLQGAFFFQVFSWVRYLHSYINYAWDMYPAPPASQFPGQNVLI